MESAIRKVVEADKAYLADDAQMYPWGVLDAVREYLAPFLSEEERGEDYP